MFFPSPMRLGVFGWSWIPLFSTILLIYCSASEVPFPFLKPYCVLCGRGSSFVTIHYCIMAVNIL